MRRLTAPCDRRVGIYTLWRHTRLAWRPITAGHAHSRPGETQFCDRRIVSGRGEGVRVCMVCACVRYVRVYGMYLCCKQTGQAYGGLPEAAHGRLVRLPKAATVEVHVIRTAAVQAPRAKGPAGCPRKAVGYASAPCAVARAAPGVHSLTWGRVGPQGAGRPGLAKLGAPARARAARPHWGGI